MELQQLKYFRTVAQVGKISEAAQELYISAPALSTSIARLEKELGMKLFDRSSNRITLNRQGQIFLRYVNQVFASLDCAEVELRQSLAQQERHVPVATTTSNLWIDLLTGFSQEHPQFTLSCTNVRPSQLEAVGLPAQCSFLLAEDADGELCHGEELESIALFTDEPAVMMHPEHPLASRERLSLADIQDQTLYYPMTGNSLSQHLIHLFELAGMPVPPGHAYSYLVYRHMVEEGMGMCFTTIRASRNEAGNLRCVPLENPGRPWTMRLFWHKNRTLTADEQVFRRFVERFYGLH